jgi:hypothetical protein
MLVDLQQFWQKQFWPWAIGGKDVEGRTVLC